MNKINKNLKLVNSQLIGIFLFIVCLFISFLISYNEKLILEDKEPFFSNKESLNISLINRIILVFLGIYFVYDAIERKKINNNDSNLQIIASLLSLSASLVILYIVIINYNQVNFSNSQIEEPI